jgi:hypothetical protein
MSNQFLERIFTEKHKKYGRKLFVREGSSSTVTKRDTGITALYFL